MSQHFTRVALASIALLAFASTSWAEGLSQPTAETVETVLRDQMGAQAKDLKAEVEQGTVKLSGWAKGPREVNQARYIVSKIPGVERAYSNGVHTWSTTDQ